jgi:hypothetical protein
MLVILNLLETQNKSGASQKVRQENATQLSLASAWSFWKAGRKRILPAMREVSESEKKHTF